MPTYYSQHGEDAILWQLFKNQQAPGFFVEIGALDGSRFSNTYSFELEGWTGICVEAHPDYIRYLNQKRPNSVVVHAAVAERMMAECVFYTNRRGSLSTLDPTLENHFRKKFGRYFTGFEPRIVPMVTLDHILQKNDAPHTFDILSIDVEGAELRVLRGFNLGRYHPRVMVIEAENESALRALDEYLIPKGYIHARELSPNVFYCRNPSDVKAIQEASIDVPLIHTTHPLDQINLEQSGAAHRRPRRNLKNIRELLKSVFRYFFRSDS